MNPDLTELTSIVITNYALDEEHKNVTHQPLVVTFSAVPGSGKTTLAKLLAPKIEAIQISRDQIRNLISDLPHHLTADQKRTILDDANVGIYRLVADNWPNKRVIIDASIDRTYDSTKRFLGDNVALYIVRVVPLWHELNDRIRLRAGTEGAKHLEYLEMMEEWRSDWDKFGDRVTPDFIWDQQNERPEVIASLIAADIDKRFR